MNIDKDYKISPSFRFTLWGVIGVFVLALISSFIFQTEITVKGQARTLPKGDVWKIHSQMDGIISSYHIFNGKEVKKGETLITLEDDIYRKNINNIKESLAESQCLTDSYSFLLSLSDEELYQDINLDNQKDKCVAFNVSLHFGRLFKQLNQLKLTEKQYEDKIKSYGAEKLLLTDIAQLSRDNFERQEKLYEKKLTTLLNFEQAQQSYLSSQQRLSELNSEISTLEYRLKLSQKERETEINNNRYSWFMNRASSQQDVNEFTIALDTEKHIQERTTITAPIDGIIDNKNINGVGDIVSQQVEIASIIPSGEDLIVRANFLNRDIGLVSKGQKAWIKLDAFPMERYELLEGKVTHISSESVLLNNEWFYAVDIHLNRQYILEKTLKHPLKSGMTGEADIVVGKRRLISFLFEPIFRAFYEVAKEP